MAKGSPPGSGAEALENPYSFDRVASDRVYAHLVGELLGGARPPDGDLDLLAQARTAGGPYRNRTCDRGIKRTN